MKKAAIIGAGLGGLTAGNLLAQAGHEVTIFESQSEPGGYTSGFKRKGFYFETGAIGVSNSRDIFPLMKKLGIFEKIGFEQHHPFRYVSEDFDMVPHSYWELRDELFRTYPEEEKALTGFFKVVDSLHNALERFLTSQSLVSRAVAAVQILYIQVRYRKISSKDFVAQYFTKGTHIYNLLSFFIGFPHMSLFMLGAYMCGIYQEYWSVKGGMLQWARVLADNFKSLGGTLNLNAPVSQIVIEDALAQGVISNGEFYKADYVIAANDLTKTVCELIGEKHFPAAYIDKMKKAPLSESWVLVYLGLDIPEDTLKEIMQSSHIHGYRLSNSSDAQSAKEQSRDSDYFKHCRFELYSPSMDNPSLAPEGKSSLMLMAFCPNQWMNNWGKGNKDTYTELKNQMQEELINRAEQIIPDLSGKILYKDAATPHTIERFTGNSKGAICSWGMGQDRKFYRSEISINIKTPIKNLLIGSSWAAQVGATSLAVAAGKKCAKHIGI